MKIAEKHNCQYEVGRLLPWPFQRRKCALCSRCLHEYGECFATFCWSQAWKYYYTAV